MRISTLVGIMIGLAAASAHPMAATAAAQPPEAPENLIVRDQSMTDVTIEWDAPASGADVSSYLIDVETINVAWGDVSGPSQWWTHEVAAAETSATFPADPGFEFLVSVVAVGSGGQSEPATIDGFTVGSDPTSPLDVWTTPLSEIVWDTGGCAGPNPTSPGVCVGWSEPANQGFWWSVDVNTDPMSFSYESDQTVDAYVVEYRANDGGWQSVSTSDTSIQITDAMVTGALRQFRVSAVNQQGTGAPSAIVTAGVATAPQEVTARLGTDALEVEWIAPLSDGGSPIEAYELQYRSGDAQSWQSLAVSGTTASVSGLPQGSSVQVRIAAQNVYGTGEWSTPISTFVAGAPAAPTDVVVDAGDGALAVRWSAPADDGGSPITDYQVVVTDSDGQDVTRERTVADSLTVSGLSNGTGYRVSVQAENGYGISDPTDPVSATPATLPGEVSALAARSGSGAVTLSWTAPASDGGAAVSGYTVQYATDAERGGDWITWSSSPTVTSATLTGLTGGVQYRFRVAAVNALGLGAYTDYVTASPTAPQVTSSSDVLTPGESHTLIVSGLSANTSHVVVLHSTPIVLGSAQTDAAGTLTLTFTTPVVDAGAHEIWVHAVTASSDPLLIHDVEVQTARSLAATGVDATKALALLGLAVSSLAIGVVLSARAHRGRLAR